MYKLSKHPMFDRADEIADICQPLDKLGISYFAHVHIDNGSQFSALSNHPRFGHHYLKHHYYNADIHLAENSNLQNFILGDALHLTGLSKKINQEAMEFGIRHLFTIIRKNKSGMDFYHFATQSISPAINQIYISHLDLLNIFIDYFKNQVQSSRALTSAYDMKFILNPCSPGFTISYQDNEVKQMRADFLKKINHQQSKILKNPMLINKKNGDKILLSMQQFKCLYFLFKGLSTKNIANELHLSTRTVENYIFKIRNMLNCKTSKELIIHYYLQS